MPTFDIVSVGEAKSRSASGKRAELLQEYIGYIQRVAPGEAGRLTVSEGETTQAIRRRLGAAAEALGTSLDIRRTANVVLLFGERAALRRRGRPRKNRSTSLPCIVAIARTGACPPSAEGRSLVDKSRW